MTLQLYFHPLSSFCQKALIALYETETPFEPHLVDLGNEESRAAFLKIWPVGQFPVLRDDADDRTIPESTIIIEYLSQHFSGKARLIPSDLDLARQTRMRDRFYDLHIHIHMQKIVGDRIRPEDKKDPFGVEQARTRMETALGLVDQDMESKRWAMGDNFTMADCAAAPALWYANKLAPFGETHKHARAYLGRLERRPSFARALKEAEPYLAMFPQ